MLYHHRAREAGVAPGHHGDPCPPSPHCSGTLTGGLSFPSVCWEQSFFASGHARLAKLGPCVQKRPRLGRAGSPGLRFYSPKRRGFSTAVHLEGLLAAVPLGIQRGLARQVPWALTWLCNHGQPGVCPQAAPTAICRRTGASGRSGVSSLGCPSCGCTAFLPPLAPYPGYPLEW